MIAFKTLKITSTGTLNTFDERHIGGAGGQPDYAGFILDATGATATTTMQVNLPKASLSEGRMIWFTVVNPNSKIITIAPPTSGDSSARINITGLIQTSIQCAVDKAQVIMVCNGTHWYATSDASFF